MTGMRLALRGLRSALRLSVAAVLCIGLGAAATTSVATLVEATLIRPLPFPHAERLVRVWFEEPGVTARVPLSIPDLAGRVSRRHLFRRRRACGSRDCEMEHR